jgi:hypothetical protein
MRLRGCSGGSLFYEEETKQCNSVFYSVLPVVKKDKRNKIKDLSL